ncbi:MAG: hypothetical protein ACOVO0_07385, partial [Burkholderiaceae bacterium]
KPMVSGFPLVSSYVTPVCTRALLAGRCKGVANVMAATLGAMLTFMMGVMALSLPELRILRKVLSPRLVAA